jgi:hypothetical protein
MKTRYLETIGYKKEDVRDYLGETCKDGPEWIVKYGEGRVIVGLGSNRCYELVKSQLHCTELEKPNLINQEGTYFRVNPINGIF